MAKKAESSLTILSLFTTLCYCDVQSQSLMLGGQPFPKFALTALAQVTWTPERNPKMMERDLENLHGKLTHWSEVQTNRSRCQQSLVQLAFDTVGRLPYALKALDATGKLESGLMTGNSKWYGRYYECEKIMTGDFQGKWCSFVAGKKSPLTNTIEGITIGLCVPNTCSEEDLNDFISFFKKKQSSTIMLAQCPVQPTQWKAADVIFVIFFSIFIILLITGTVIEIIVTKKDEQKRELLLDDVTEASDFNQKHSNDLAEYQRILLCFSIIKNTRTLFRVEKRPGTIDCLHGMRFLSMTWVVLGHTFVFMLGTIDNLLDMYDYFITNFAAQAVMNAFFAVDSFFFISGLLIAYLSLKDADRLKISRIPMLYLQRYLRLTPAYAFMILFLAGILGKLGNGPFWPATAAASCDACEKYWWTNLLYINNLHPSSLLNECFALGWYLANDMQFFLLAPISLLAFKRNKVAGLGIILFGLCSSIITTGVISSHYQLQPLPVIGALLLNPNNASSSASLQVNPTMSSSDVFWSDTYAKPWCRIGVYLIGMLTGCLLAATKCNIRMSKIFALFGWAIAAAFNLSVLYGVWWYVTNVEPMNVNLAAFYDAMCRPIWACGLAWVVIACASGYGGPVNAFLSWKALVPLSRLTYCTYLVHPTIIQIWVATQEVNVHFSIMQMSFYFLGILTMAHGAAYLLSMLVEAPCVNLVKLLSEKYANRPPRNVLLVNEPLQVD